MEYTKNNNDGITRTDASEKMIDYYLELARILEYVSDAYSKVVECIGEIQEDIYKGEVRNEMENYFETMSVHFFKMMLLYGGAIKYVINVLNTFNQIDSDSTSSLTNGEKNKK